MKHGKKYIDAAKLIENNKTYDPNEALELCCKTATAKFDETVELHVRLGVDSRHADQQVRGAVVLPNGTGKNVRVIAIAKGDAAKAAGAEFVGAEDMMEKIQKENWMDFDVVIATPDMMGIVGRLGKILGPRGLMPNPKAGTVTPDAGRAVTEAKAGKIEYRLDKANIIHVPIGKASFGAEKLMTNLDTVLDAIAKAKPAAAKGQYFKGDTAIALSPDDPAAAARILCKFADADKSKRFVVKGGFCDGQVMDAAGIKSLSTMPNREGLLSMLAGSLNGIVGGLAVALQGIVDKQDETAA